MTLLWCARPDLRHNISASRTVLNDAAHFIAYKQCGSAGPPNNVAGWGRVDILAAVATSPPQCSPAFCRPAVVFEYFDGVTPPALPPDWVAINAQGPPPLWVTSNSGVPMPPADTPPNAAFIDDPAIVSDKRLSSANLAIFEGYVTQLSFRHNFNFEASDVNPNLGFDGVCLSTAPMAEIHFNMSLPMTSSSAAITARSAPIAAVRLLVFRHGAGTEVGS